MNIDKPARLIIELTDKCNLRCIHCFANKSDNELPYKKWINIFQKSIDENISSISITGGEPLLYLDLFKILDNIDTKSTKITLDSNGLLINDKNIEPIKKHFKLVRISIYGTNNDDSKKITNVNNYNYNKIINSIKLLSENEIKIQINIPLFKENITNMNKILEDLSKFNIYEIVFIPILPIGLASNMKKQLLSEEETKKIYEKYKNNINTKLRLFKWAEGKHFLIRADGKVYIHPFYINNKATDLYLGNIQENSINDLWKNVEKEYKINNATLTPNLKDI